MKRLVATLLLVVSSIVFPINHAFAQKTVKRIAVYDFDDKLVQGEIQKTYGEKKNIGALVASWVSQALVQNSNFEVIDRAKIEQIMKEQNQQFSDRFDPSDAPKIGKLLNVDAIVTGSVQQMHSSAKAMKFPHIPGTPQVLLEAQSTNLHADATVAIQVVSTETAKIFWADKSNAKKDQNVDSGTVQSSPVAPVMDAALEQAVGKLTSGLIEKGELLPVRQMSSAQTAESTKPASPTGSDGAVKSATTTAPASAKALKVGRVEGKEVYILAGKADGLKVGQLLEVRRVSATMDDGKGGKVSIYKTVEVEVVTDVEDDYAVAEPQKGAQSQAQKDDTVRPTSAAADKSTSSTAEVRNAK